MQQSQSSSTTREALSFATTKSELLREAASFATTEPSPATTGNFIDEGTMTKVIRQLNETIGVILEYLEDAKERGQKKGDDLLASVRIIGSYLAEAPLACKEKVQELLGCMLSVQGEDEQR